MNRQSVFSSIVFLALFASPTFAADEKPAGEPAPAAPAPTDPFAEAGADWSKSMGESLSALNVQTTWTGYGHFILESEAGKPVTFEATSFNPILVVRMTEKLSAEMELEITPEGIGAEYVLVDYAVQPWLTVRSGKFLVPIGKFNETLHPSFRWNMIDVPLLFKEVMPLGWNDVGVQLRGKHTLSRSLKLEWVAFAMNGLQAERNGREVNADGTLPDAEENVIHEARPENRPDNNSDKAFGGKINFILFSGQEAGATEIGVSGMSGALDEHSAWRASLIDVDATMQLWGFMLRGEAAQSFINPEGKSLTAFERGFYIQASYQAGDVNIAARWDYVAERPMGGDVRVRRQVAVSASHSISRYMNMRAEVEMPIGMESPIPSFHLMWAFSF